MWAPNKGEDFWNKVIDNFAGKEDLHGSDYCKWSDVDNKVKTEADKNIASYFDHLLFQNDQGNEPYFRTEMQNCVKECYKPGGPTDEDILFGIYLGRYENE